MIGPHVAVLPAARLDSVADYHFSQSRDMTMQIAVSVAFLCILVSGFLIRRRTASLEEHSIARGEMGWFRIAAGISMTFAGGAAVINMASIGYTFGWYALIDPIALALGVLVAIAFLSRYRSDTGVTMAQLLSRRYRPLALTTGLIAALVYLLVLSAQVVALSKLLAPLFPAVPLTLLTVVPTTLVFLYTIKGGFVSVTVTDVVQLLFVMACLLLPMAYFAVVPAVVGPDAPADNASYAAMPLNLCILFSLSLLFIPLSQDTNLRIKAASTSRDAVVGLLVGAGFYGAIVLASSLAGMWYARSVPGLADPEHVFTLFFSQRGSWPAVLPIIAALMAIVSSLDAYILNTMTAISQDIVGNLRRARTAHPGRDILVSASVTYVLALLVALYFNQVLSLVLFALLLYIALLGPIAVGNYLRLPAPLVFRAAVVIASLLVAYRLFGLALGPEAIVYPTIGLSVMLTAFVGERALRRPSAP